MALVASSRRHHSLLLLSSSPSPPPTAPLRRHHSLLLSSFAAATTTPSSPPSATSPAPAAFPKSRPYSSPSIKKETRASCEPFLAAAGMLDHALLTLDESPPSACASRTGRTAFCLNALLSVLINSHLSSSCRRVAHLSRRLSIASDKVSYGILVKSYCLASDAKDVLLVLEKMERRDRGHNGRGPASCKIMDGWVAGHASTHHGLSSLRKKSLYGPYQSIAWPI